MQHTDKAIAEFEAWWDRQPFREQFEDVKDQMRNVWLASRREWAISLPKRYGLPSIGARPEYAEYNRAVQDCRAAIEAAGVTVRG